jgi:nitrogen fixation/metabolism regulation signal transduction histidine kinase
VRRSRLSHEWRVVLYALATALPPALMTLGFVWLEPHSQKLRWTVTLAVALSFVGLSWVLEEVARPLQTLANLLAALRERDFSVRGYHGREDDALGVALGEANALSATLRAERYGALEANSLVRKVMEAIDVALFVFAADGRLTLANGAAARLTGHELAALAGRRADELGLAALLDGPSPRTLSLTLAGVTRQLEVRRGPVRQSGAPHTLVVVADLSTVLRAEERHALERLVRVLGHEINNSLAPIQSIAGSLRQRLQRPRPSDPGIDEKYESDLARGLSVIERRAESLGRFMTSYARLARLPPPQLGDVEVAAWVRRVAELEKRRPVTVAPGPSLSVRADGDQLDQLLINLVRNAVDAASETDGAVDVGWTQAGDRLVVQVRDEGPGLGSTRNLFVPFFTTKSDGSGIGLVLSRQIAENHGGTLTLENRADRPGCLATVSLPL